VNVWHGRPTTRSLVVAECGLNQHAGEKEIGKHLTTVLKPSFTQWAQTRSQR